MLSGFKQCTQNTHEKKTTDGKNRTKILHGSFMKCRSYRLSMERISNVAFFKTTTPRL